MRILLVVCFSAIVAIGCGKVSGPRKHELTGTVTYAGNPIPIGSITFQPDHAKGNKGPTGTAAIKDGRFKTSPGFGVVGGDYVIKVMGFDGVPVKTEDGMDEAGTPLFKTAQIIRMSLPESSTTLDLTVPKVVNP